MNLVEGNQRRGCRAGYGGAFGRECNFAKAFGQCEQRMNARDICVIEDHPTSDPLANKQPHDSAAQHLVALNNRLRAFQRVAIVDKLLSDDFHSHCRAPNTDAPTQVRSRLPFGRTCNENVQSLRHENSGCIASCIGLRQRGACGVSLCSTTRATALATPRETETARVAQASARRIQQQPRIPYQPPYRSAMTVGWVFLAWLVLSVPAGVALGKFIQFGMGE